MAAAESELKERLKMARMVKPVLVLFLALAFIATAAALGGDIGYLDPGVVQTGTSWTNGSYTINASAERGASLAAAVSGGWGCSGSSCPTWTEDGVVGGAYSFDGVDDSLSLTVTEDKTSVSFWYKAAGAWTHVVNSSGDTYVDGAPASPAVYPIYIDGDTVYAGMTGASSYFNGSIDEVRIYNRSLSAEEIQSLYELGSAEFSDWSEWQNEGVVSDGVPLTSASSGKFMQYKALFNSDNTSVSPYLLSHNVTAVAGASPSLFCGGSGTEGDPYLICDWYGLNATRDNLTTPST